MEWTMELRLSIIKNSRKVKRSSWKEGEFLEYKTVNGISSIHFVTTENSSMWSNRQEDRCSNDWDYIN